MDGTEHCGPYKPHWDERDVGAVRQLHEPSRIHDELCSAVGQPAVHGLAVPSSAEALVAEAPSAAVDAPLVPRLAGECRVWVRNIHPSLTKIRRHVVAEQVTVGFIMNAALQTRLRSA